MIKGIRYYKEKQRTATFTREAGINDQDIFLASFPKSGNTWMRFILANALHPEKKFTLANIHETIPSIHRESAVFIRALSHPRVIKTHHAFFSLYPRCIYLVRDYRDVAVSAWHHSVNTGNFEGDISAFIRSGLLNSFGPWHWHVAEAYRRKESNPQSMMIVRYEDMQQDTVNIIGNVLRFCGFQSSITPEEIQTRTRFSRLQDTERDSVKKEHSAFFRKGAAGEWKNVLGKEDEHELLKSRETGVMMKKYGYL